MLTTAQMFELGFTERQISHRLQSGVLHRLYRGVYAFGRPTLEFSGLCLAALLACGPDAAISHASAARVWGLRRSEGAIHVIVPRGRPGHPGLRIHRPLRFSAADVTDRDGIRVTTLGRTLLDLAAAEPLSRIERLLHEAGVQRVLDAREIHRALEHHPNHRGARKVGAALTSEFAPTRSGLEQAFLALCRAVALPTPIVNGHVATSAGLEEVDFHWLAAHLVVETDGDRYHSSRWRRARDAEKTARLRAAGWTVRRFSDVDVVLAPEVVAAEMATLLAASTRR